MDAQQFLQHINSANFEALALAGGADHRQLRAHDAGVLGHDGQAQARALFERLARAALGPALQELFPLRIGDARAVVDDRQANGTRLGLAQGHRHMARATIGRHAAIADLAAILKG